MCLLSYLSHTSLYRSIRGALLGDVDMPCSTSPFLLFLPQHSFSFVLEQDLTFYYDI